MMDYRGHVGQGRTLQAHGHVPSCSRLRLNCVGAGSGIRTVPLVMQRTPCTSLQHRLEPCAAHSAGAAPFQLGSVLTQPAAGYRSTWHSACASPAAAAPRSPTAVHAAADEASPDNSGSNDSDKIAKLEQEIQAVEARILQAYDSGKPTAEIQALDTVLKRKTAELERLRPSPGAAAGRQRRPLIDIDNQFAQELFRPFPSGTVPRELVAQSLQQLLQTPLAVQVHDPNGILGSSPALQLLFTGCTTERAGGEGVVNLSDAAVGRVYHYLDHAAGMPLRPTGATDAAWAAWWSELLEAVAGIAREYAQVPVGSDRGVSEATLTIEEVTRDLVIWLDSVVLVTGNALGPMHPLSEEQAVAAQHEGACTALYGELGWAVHYEASGPRIQLFGVPSAASGICYPLTGILDVSVPRQRATLLLALINLMRMASTIANERWLPAAPGMQLHKAMVRPSPYPAPSDATAAGYTGKLVQVTVRKQSVVKEYEAPGWALQQNLRIYDLIQDNKIPHTVKVVSVMVDNELHGPWREYAKDAWYSVRIVMSPPAYQRNPGTPAELWLLLRDLLELLSALHLEGMVHRDIRLQNIYRFLASWLLSDWELAAPAGLKVPYKIKRLPQDVKSGVEAYTYSHDLWQVAEVIKELRKPAASSLKKCEAAAAFAKLLVEPQMTANKALEVLHRTKHEWS